MLESQFAGEPKRACDIMARRLVTVSPTTDLAHAIQLLLKNGISGMPVVDAQGRYLGVFSEKCCMEVLAQTSRLAGDEYERAPRARDVMISKLFTLPPQQDAIEAIGALLKRKISGAPVTDPQGRFLGVFSEKTAMNLLIEAAYDQLPSATVGSFMNPDSGRLIDEQTDLLTITKIFIETPYRRLEVVRNGTTTVQGQISRRDVLKSSRILETIIRYHGESSAAQRLPGPDSVVLLRAHERLPSTHVDGFMDTQARTITEDVDLLSIAQLFLNTPYRRLPVLRDGRVVGQVSRRDVLAAVYKLLAPVEVRESTFLYFSATRDRTQAPVA